MIRGLMHYLSRLIGVTELAGSATSSLLELSEGRSPKKK